MPDNLPPTSPTLLCINLGRSLYTVATAIKEAGISPDDHRMLFITEHAHNISLLLGNVGTMGHKFQSYATKLIVRPLYESMFNMIAAIREPSFARSKMLSECNDGLKKLGTLRRKQVEDGKDTALVDGRIAELGAATQTWQTANNVQARKWNTWEICELAGCTELYLQYQMLCDHTHVAFSAINPLTKPTRGNLLDQSAFAGTNALREYRNYVDPARQQEHVREAEVNMAMIQQMVEDGSYERIDWEDGPLRR